MTKLHNLSQPMTINMHLSHRKEYGGWTSKLTTIDLAIYNLKAAMTDLSEAKRCRFAENTPKMDFKARFKLSMTGLLFFVFCLPPFSIVAISLVKKYGAQTVVPKAIKSKETPSEDAAPSHPIGVETNPTHETPKTTLDNPQTLPTDTTSDSQSSESAPADENHIAHISPDIDNHDDHSSSITSRPSDEETSPNANPHTLGRAATESEQNCYLYYNALRQTSNSSALKQKKTQQNSDQNNFVEELSGRLKNLADSQKTASAPQTDHPPLETLENNSFSDEPIATDADAKKDSETLSNTATDSRANRYLYYTALKAIPSPKS